MTTCTTPANASLYRTLLTDGLLLLAACSIPAVSHLFALPLYQLNPMLLILLSGMLLVRDSRNAYLLAVLLPVVSMLVVGMPSAAKCLCMVAEYGVVVTGTLWALRSRNHWVRFGGILLTLMGSKVAYYTLKMLLLSPATFAGSPDALVGTPLLVQMVPILAAALLMPLLARKR